MLNMLQTPKLEVNMCLKYTKKKLPASQKPGLHNVRTSTTHLQIYLNFPFKLTPECLCSPTNSCYLAGVVAKLVAKDVRQTFNVVHLHISDRISTQTYANVFEKSTFTVKMTHRKQMLSNTLCLCCLLRWGSS